MKKTLKILLFLCIIGLIPYILGVLIALWYIPAAALLLFCAYKIYQIAYFRGKKFVAIKERIQSYVDNANELNRHIEELKSTGIVSNRLNGGSAVYADNSKWKMRRSELKNSKYAPNVHQCSRTVCDGARKEPFKYVCKYFGISTSEESLAQFESMLNNFEAAEDGKIALRAEREAILNSIKSEIPFLIRTFSKKALEKKVGFDEVNFNDVYFPTYTFQYVSSGGNASTRCDITMDIQNLNNFVTYLAEKVKFKKSAAGQRALMTSKLRTQIKERDGYACKICGASVQSEPHLLLEIDHIVPVSKGGLTTPDNLQALCWKCNRSKGAKL